MSRRLKRHRGKLMARQLWYLAVLDMLFCAFVTPFHTLVFLVSWRLVDNPAAGLSILCTLDWSCTIALIPLVFLDIHIALAMTSTARQWHATLRFLSQCLAPMVLAGVFLGIVHCVVFHANSVQWDPSTNYYTDTFQSELGYRIFYVTNWALALLAIGIYISGTCNWTTSERTFGTSLRARFVRRALLFLVSNIASTVPIGVFFFIGSRISSDSTGPVGVLFRCIADPLFLLHGFVDTMVYVRLSHSTQKWARPSLPSAGSVRGGESIQAHRSPAAVGVTFGGTERIDISLHHTTLEAVPVTWASFEEGLLDPTAAEELLFSVYEDFEDVAAVDTDSGLSLTLSSEFPVSLTRDDPRGEC